MIDEALSPLELDIRRRIQVAGPMPIAEYMAICLLDPQHGYYMTRDPFGIAGDFITAPEVSQMFGELIGLWMAATWRQMESPENVRIIELGPGRGTMMNDALRAAQVMPAFRAAAVADMVEVSPVLRGAQERTLEGLTVPVMWHRELQDVPPGPAIIVANEFFDALPINQAVKKDDGWHERQVAIGEDDKFAFTIAPDPIPHFDRLLPPHVRVAHEDAILEWRSDNMAMEVAKRVMNGKGAALVIDYGHAESAIGETLQAIGGHAFTDTLTAPGRIDLTAHVDFQAIARAAESMGAVAHGPIVQSELLRRLGIQTRAAALKAKAGRDSGAAIDAALARLIGFGRTGMGDLFKALAIAHPKLGKPPGFDQ
ncbi:MAG: class I SAM-dependent methyltransferase [Pseudolabrys sp.]|jgi:NADH dehydrogenase [ubiquinone] 1 alpha subcomplex assembly factor 7